MPPAATQRRVASIKRDAVLDDADATNAVLAMGTTPQGGTTCSVCQYRLQGLTRAARTALQSAAN